MRVKKSYTMQVYGRGVFPFDMLRYDCCWPMDGASASALGHTERRSVLLTSAKPPTPARWESFGWKITWEEHKDRA